MMGLFLIALAAQAADTTFPTQIGDTARAVTTVLVEGPSAWPGAIIGFCTLVLLFFQLRVLRRQAGIMETQVRTSGQQADIMLTQAQLAVEQHKLEQQQADWRRTESIGTFYRLAHDLVAELRKSDVLPGRQVQPDYKTHPRQMLREASRLFAPLGGAFVEAANQVAMRLDQYFTAVLVYDQDVRGPAGAAGLMSVLRLREEVGDLLDSANFSIPNEDRLKTADGADLSYRGMCAPDESLVEAITIEMALPPGGSES